MNTETPLTKPKQETTEITNLKAHPPPNVGKIALRPTTKNNLSPSSINSSPDSPLDDPFNSDDDSDGNDDDDDDSISSEEVSLPLHKRARSPLSENHVPDPQQPSDNDPHAKSPITCNSSLPVNDNGSPTEAPCNQAMRRVSSTYRIPSSIFARSKSSDAQTDWSVASNESLFSIYMGNMSFRNDNPLWRSGELGTPAGEASTSDHMFSYSAQQPKCAEIMRSRELGLAEATMKEVIRESESRNYVTSCRSSHGSGTSTTSFAFSLKEGDHSQKVASSRTPSSVRSISEEQAQCKKQPLTMGATETPQSSTNCDPTATDHAPKPNPPRPKWSSCFSCCSLWWCRNGCKKF
ncbi:hypothetical protein OROHE_010919 [Orobanche hederae]